MSIDTYPSTPPHGNEAHGSDFATQEDVDNATASEGFRAYLSTAQTLSASTYEKLIFDAKERDDGGDYDPTTGEWTVPATRWYDLGYGAFFVSLADGEEFRLQLRIGGIADTNLLRLNQGAAGGAWIAGSLPMHFTAGELVSIYAQRGSAGDVAGSQASTFFTAKRR